MKSIAASLVKNALLICLLCTVVSDFYFPLFKTKELLAIEIFAGLIYVCVSCYEYLNASLKASLPVQRFPYFSNNYLMFKAFKIGVFFTFSTLLFLADGKIKWTYPICLIIALTEAVVLVLKYNNSLCFINIYANYILLAEDKIQKIFASQISLVEYRHEIFYFIKKNGKTIQFNLMHIRKQEHFVHSITNWLERNQVLVKLPLAMRNL